MATKSPDSDFDLVLYGATGFVGALTAHYIAEHAPSGLRWAIAGRNAAKLDELIGELPGEAPATIIADSTDAASVARLVARTKLVITTVGPYAAHGEPMVKACAETGTDYLDLTGEPGFVDAMYLKYHEVARSSGARIVHAAGFDSIPADLGAYFTVLQLPEHAPISVESRVRVSGMYSGGTVHSAVDGLGSPMKTISAVRERRKVEAKPTGRRISTHFVPLKRDRELGMWVAPLPTIDQLIVERSAAALDRYGPEFSYGHHYAAKRLATVAVGTAAVGAVAVGSLIPPVRGAIKRRFPAGSGPDPERRAKSWFRIEFVGRSGEQSVRTAISGGDAGYEETAKMISETAFALLFDDVPERAGQLTPVAAAGDALLERLPAAGIKLEVL